MDDQEDDISASSSEDNTPRTPPHTVILRPKNIARSFTAPSKLPKPKLHSTRYPLSPSRPQTRYSPPAPSTPLDWGSSGEWSRWAEDIERGSPAMSMSSRLIAESGSFLEEVEEVEDEEASDGEMLPSAPVESAARALQSAISFDPAFDETHERASPNAEQSTIPLPTTAEEVERNTAATPQSARSVPVAKVLRFDTSPVYCEPGSGQMLIQNPPTNVGNSRVNAVKATRSTENTELATSQVKMPLTTASKPVDSNAETTTSTETTEVPSPQTILRGLIRGAHREMLYFTLSHERFSLNDIREGLDYAFGMLQAAQSKLAILTILHDDMTDASAVDLRSWLTQLDHLDRPTTRIFVMFESLSSGEIRVALAEVVQSRLIVEDEVKRTKALLTKRLTELESNKWAWLGAAGDCVDSLQNEFAGTAGGLLGENEAEWDVVFTAVMTVVIGALYFCVR